MTKIELSTKDPDGWFVESVKIQSVGAMYAGKQKTDFVFDRWVQYPESPRVSSTRSVDYKVKLKTGMLPGADSVGQFFLKVFGTGGETKRLRLATGFKKGDTFETVLRSRDVGKMNKVQLSTASADGWMCESLQVSVNDKITPFPGAAWVQHPGKSVVDVLAGVEYVITVRTGTLAEAGTKGTAYITLFGQRTSTPKLLLKTGIKAGSYETFRLISKDVGYINFIKLSMEHKDTWLCESVEIASAGKKTGFFRVNKNIGKPHLPGVTVRTDSKYVFSVLTGSSSRAASTASVSVHILGTLGITRKLHLQTGFERGANRVTTLMAADVGKVVAIHLETQDDDDVHLERVGLRVARGAEESQYRFVANQWLKAPLFPEATLFSVVPYHVSIDTGAGAPYSGSAYITLFGNLGVTSRNLMSAPFLPNKSRSFIYQQPVIGRVSAVRLYIYNQGSWAPTNVAVRSGGLVSLCPMHSPVTAATGAANAASTLQYHVVPDHSIIGASRKTAVIQTIPKSTSAGCMGECAKRPMCKSLVYERKKGHCVLLSKDRSVGFDFQGANGVDYFELFQSKPKKATADPKVAFSTAREVRALDDSTLEAD